MERIEAISMTTFAYCRVSTLDQHTGIQEEAIKKAYPDAVVRHEKASGTTRDGREVLSLLLDMIGQGDKLVVWKLDRLARNMNDLTGIVDSLESKRASLEVLDQRIDTSTASGRAFLQMLGVFAEFETNLRKERQLAGIEKAKREGKYQGRRRSIDAEEVKRLKNSGMRPTDIAKKLGIGRTSVYRLLEA
ncbi:recombinase family protein [Marinobacter alexandrii]|jgi:DNA invertase Pin-like site-specific DNA recombinase|uniref:recombinase family protein n=2 Tax=Pseudomonadota TaxID=1224 RepID=UPI0032993000